MIQLLPLIVLSLAAYRITRLFLFDTIIENIRGRFYALVANGKWFPRLRSKVLDLTSCSWCLGFWVSLALFSLYTRTSPWELGVNGWISVFAVAALQGVAHAFEPGDDE